MYKEAIKKIAEDYKDAVIIRKTVSGLRFNKKMLNGIKTKIIRELKHVDDLRVVAVTDDEGMLETVIIGFVTEKDVVSDICTIRFGLPVCDVTEVVREKIQVFLEEIENRGICDDIYEYLNCFEVNFDIAMKVNKRNIEMHLEQAFISYSNYALYKQLHAKYGRGR